jgi:hypothetical protein
MVLSTGIAPNPAGSQNGDDAVLIAASMAPHEHLVIDGVPNGKAWIAIIMRRASCHPCAADPPTSKRLGDGLGRHRQPRPELTGSVVARDLTSMGGSRDKQSRRSSAVIIVRFPAFRARSKPDPIQL